MKDLRYFTYLRDSRAAIGLVLGDARLTLAKAPRGQYDLLILDAFSSDSLPMHLVTREAFQLYLDKLHEDGVLAMNISNRFLDLKPVVGKLAGEAGLICWIQQDTHLTDAQRQEGKFSSCWAAMSRRAKNLGRLPDDPRWQPAPVDGPARVWTDDFSDIVSVMTW